MNIRSCRIDLFRHTFPRFIIGSIFIVGCLLMISILTDSRLPLNSQDSSVWRQRSSKNFSSNIQSQKKSKQKTGQLPTATEAEARHVYKEEEFPKIKDLPSVSSILSTFHQKVALRDRKLINPHDYDYILNAPNACVGKKVELVIAVPTRTDSFEARQAIRDTWGAYGANTSNNAVLIFFLGATSSETVQDKIAAESLKYGDIVQEDFVDSYRNLSLKTIELLKWVSMYCSESTFVLKADDDMYINMPLLLQKLREQLARGPVFLMGVIHYSTSPFRDKKNKWFVTREEYPSKMFPNYLSGTAYAMTTSAAMRLYVESLYVKNLFLEDVYLTGLVADRAGIPRVREKNFNSLKFDPEGCNFKARISGHRNTPDEIRKIHKELFDPDLRCDYA